MLKTNPIRELTTSVVALLGSLFVVLAMVAQPAVAHAQPAALHEPAVLAQVAAGDAEGEEDPVMGIQSADFDPSRSVEYTNGDVYVRMTMDFVSAGSGQTPASGKPCVVTEKLGYPIGDESPTDNNTCAGDRTPAVYDVGFSYRTGKDPVTLTIKPEWVERHAIEGMGEPTGEPVPAFQLTQGSAVNYVKNKDGSYTFTFQPSPGATKNIGWKTFVTTIEPRRKNQAEFSQAGAWRLGARVYEGDSTSGKEVGVAKADKDLNVLAVNRMDQRIINVVRDLNYTVFDRKTADVNLDPNAPRECAEGDDPAAPAPAEKPERYLGLSATSNLTWSWDRTDTNAIPAGYDTVKGILNGLSPDTISRFKLIKPAGISDEAMKKVRGTWEGEDQTVKFDEQGNAYFDHRYTAADYQTGALGRFKFFVPINELSEGNYNWDIRMDTVNPAGEPTSVIAANGTPLYMPDAKGNVDLGNGTEDPGNLTECSAPTSDKSQGTQAGTRLANNNCARQPIEIKYYECEENPNAQGCDTYIKDDRVVSRKADFVPNLSANGRSAEPVNSANVAVTIPPGSDMSVCLGWKPGAQQLVDGRLTVVGGQNLQDIFPGAKIYYTNSDFVDQGNEAKPVDCKAADWKIAYDQSKSVNIEPRNVFDGGIRDITGIYVALPGQNIVTAPTTMFYRINGFNADKVKAFYDKGTPGYNYVEDTAGESYLETWNYALIENGCHAPQLRKSRTMFSRPEAGIQTQSVNVAGAGKDAALGADTSKANMLGPSRHSFKTVPTINWANGPDFINGVDNQGNKTRIINRMYFSKCITADTDNLPPNSVVHADSSTSSDNPNDCGYDKNRYIETTWVLSDQPSNDPLVPRWPLLKKKGTAPFSATNGTNADWGFQPEFGFVTPGWTAPKSQFNIMSEWRITGTPEITDPNAADAGPVDSRVKGAVPSPAPNKPQMASGKGNVEPWPLNYKPLNSSVSTMRIWVPEVVSGAITKTPIDTLIPVNNRFSHSLALASTDRDPDSVLGATDFIDVLPYKGDGRGTEYSGKYWLSQLPTTVPNDFYEIYYTDERPWEVSMCPPQLDRENWASACSADLLNRHDTRGDNPNLDRQPSENNWRPLTQQAIADHIGKDPSEGGISALRFRSKNFPGGAYNAAILTFDTRGNHANDVYANSAGPVSVMDQSGTRNTSPVPPTEIVETRVYAGEISGRVYVDANEDGDYVDGEAPGSARPVALYECNEENGELKCGDEPYAVTELKPDGTYSFKNLPAGTYRVQVRHTDGDEINTESGKNPENIGKWESDPLVIRGISPERNGGEPERITDIDFGYYLANPELSIEKTVNDPDVPREVNGQATFTISGANTGNVDLHAVKLGEDWVKGELNLTCTITNAEGVAYEGADLEAKGNLLSPEGANLARGDKYSCVSAPFEDGTISQADIDAQKALLNKATITGQYLDREPLAPKEATAEVPLKPAEPGLTLTKTVDGEATKEKNAGDTARFDFAITNSGNVTMNKVAIEDNFGERKFVGPITCDDLDEAPFILGESALAPGKTANCHADYEVTQDDVDAQQEIPNTAAPTGEYNNGVDSRTPFKGAESKATITVPVGTPDLEMSKKVRLKGTGEEGLKDEELLDAGQEAEWVIDFRNASVVTLKDITLQDFMTEYGPQNNVTCVDDQDPPKPFAVDGSRSLAPGKAVRCTAPFQMGGVDVDNQMRLENTAIVSGTVKDPLNPTENKTVTEQDTATVIPPEASPRVIVNKYVGDTRENANGDTVERGLREDAQFKIVVTNDGNVTLNDVQLQDTWDKNPQLAISCDGGWEPGNSLAPNESVNCWATYEVTQEDIDAGKELVNKVHVTAKAKNSSGTNTDVENEGDDPTAKVTVPSLTGEMVLDKRVDAQNEVSGKRVNDVVNYTIRVTNSTNMTMHKVKLDDDFRGIKFTCANADKKSYKLDGTESLAVGESVLCEGTYTLTQEDIDNGTPFTNTAVLNANPGTPDAEPIPTVEASATVSPEAAVPMIMVMKKTRDAAAPIDRDGELDNISVNADQDTQFDFWFKNTGTSTLHNIKIKDVFDINEATQESYREGAAGAPAYECFLGEDKVDPATLVLQPNQEVRCTLSEPYKVTQDDVNQGRDITNKVFVTADSKPDANNPENVVVNGAEDATLKMPPATASIGLTKVVGQGPEQTKRLEVNEASPFTITVTNTGNVTLTNVKIEDNFATNPDLGKEPLTFKWCRLNGDPEKEVDPIAGFSFNPRETVVCETSDYTVTEADVTDQRGLPNEAIVTSEFVRSADNITRPTAKDSAKIVVPQANPSMTMDKSVAKEENGTYTNTAKRSAGETAYFKIVGANNGNVALQDAVLTDEWAKEENLTFTCAFDKQPERTFVMGEGPGVLLPGESFTCTAPYVVTQDDQDAQKSLRNLATMTATYTNGDGARTDLKQDADATVVMRDATPKFSLNKTVNGKKDDTLAEDAAAAWAITGSNDGNVTLKDFKVVDSYPKGKEAPDFACTTSTGTEFKLDEAITLAPQETFTCNGTAEAFFTGDDIVAGEDKVNTATATYTYTNDEGAQQKGEETSSATVHPVAAQPSFELNKTVDYTAGEADKDSKNVVLNVGDTAYFRITGKNTGNVVLKDVDVEDTFKDKGIKLECDPFKSGSDLAPEESFTCTYEYKVTQDDLDADKVLVNTVTMTPSFRGEKLEPKTSTATVTVPEPNAEIRLDKRLADGVERKDTFIAGDKVRYQFDVTNSGTVTLRAADIIDETLAKAGVTIDCPQGEIAPNGGKVTCTSSEYTITEADAAAGKLVNTAVATALRPNQSDNTPKEARPTSNPDVETITTGIPALTIAKTNENSGPVLENGEVLWKITVENPSPFNVTRVYIDDDQIAAADSVECHAGTTKDGDKLKGRGEQDGKTVAVLGELAPKAKATCWLSVPLEKAPSPDENGNIVNVAAVMGMFGDQPLFAEGSAPSDSASVPVVRAGSLELRKTVMDPEKVYKAGDTATYTFTMINTGQTELVNVWVSDPNFGPADICGPKTIPAGAEATCSREYTVTGDDAAAGQVENVAAAHGETRFGEKVFSSPARALIKTEKPGVKTPRLTLAKEITNGGTDKVFAEGKTVEYKLTVTNTGDVALSNVKVVDKMFGDEPFVCGKDTLEPEESTFCEKKHEVNAADAKAVTVVNIANASGVTPATPGNPGEPETPGVQVNSNSADAVFRVPAEVPPAPKPTNPALDLSKEITNGGTDKEFAEGKTVEYKLTVTNTGDVALSNVKVVDKMFGDEPFVCGKDTLEPEESTFCEKEHEVNAADAKAVTVVNIAQASGEDTTGRTVLSPQANDKFTVPMVPAPSLKLVKSIDGKARYDEGEVVNYTFEVTNTGAVALKDIAIDDPMLTDITCVDDELAIGASTTCSGTHVVTAADAEKQTVINTATATGTDPNGVSVESNKDKAAFTVTPKPEPTPVPTAPAIELTKSITNGGADKVFAKGETVTYELTVTNTGDVKLENVRVNDAMFGEEPFVCGDEVLEPKASTTCTKDHVVTDADEKAVTVVNVATANGTTPAVEGKPGEPAQPGQPVGSAPAKATFTVPAAPAPAPQLRLAKSADTAGPVKAGDTITYTFTLTNTGNAELRDLTVNDSKLSGAGVAITCDATTLPAGQETTCHSGEYKVTEADVKDGKVLNTATATGVTEGGAKVPSNEDSATVIVETPAEPGSSTNVPLWPALGLLIPLIVGGGSSTPTIPTPVAPAPVEPVVPQPAPAPQQPAPAPAPQPAPQQPAPAPQAPVKGIERPKEKAQEVRKLANTGASVLGITYGAAALVLAGMVLVMASRRRREQD